MDAGVHRTTLLVGPFASGKTRKLLEKNTELTCAGKEVLYLVGTDAFELGPNALQHKTYVLIDDLDRIRTDCREQLVKKALSASIPVLASSRIPLPGFDVVEKWSQSYLPEVHQKFLSLVFGVYRKAQAIDASPDLVLQPIANPTTDARAKAGTVALRGRIDSQTVCLGACPQPLKQALVETYANLRFSTIKDFYGKRAKSIIALCLSPLESADLLEILTRTNGPLTVVFNSEMPPEWLTRVQSHVLSLIAPQSVWINWEGYAVTKAVSRKRSRRECDSVQPKTVTALVNYLGNLCKQRDIKSTQDALELLAGELEWPMAPTWTVLNASADSIVNPCDPVHGIAAELILLRELSFVEPSTPNIILPEAVNRFRTALFVDDQQFVETWAATPALSKIKQSAEAWSELFSDERKWCSIPSNVCAELAASSTPIVLLPGHLRQHKELVESAAELYINPAEHRIPDWVLQTLAAVIQLVDQGHHATPFPSRSNEQSLRRLADRARHFWCMSHARYVSDQVPVRVDDFRGFSDFVIDNRAIMELKCSCAGQNTFAARILWPLQAAIYAYALCKPTGYVFNVNQNYIGRVSWNPNHLV